MFNRTDDAVPSKPLRSHGSSTYCRKRAVSHRHTHGRMSLHRSSGTRDLRKLTCGPRPQSAARSMPCKIPWPARSATVPLSRCTQRDAKARPRLLSPRVSRIQNGAMQKLELCFYETMHVCLPCCHGQAKPSQYKAKKSLS